LLAVPESWVREHTRSGALPRVQLGRYVRYRRQAVVAWVTAQEAPIGGQGSRGRRSERRDRPPSASPKLHLLSAEHRATMRDHASIGPKPPVPPG
jgi:hypothetical protein